MSIPARVLDEIAARFGTPCFAYDLDAVDRRVAELSAALGPRFEIAYAVKANPSLAILSLLAGLGLGADVASRGELRAARRAGFPARRLLATGPSKSDADLEALIGAGVGQIHAEGPEELERMEALAVRFGKKVRVGLRLNPEWGIEERRTIIGGPGAKKFGFDLPSARRALRERDRFPHLSIGGFQVFNASNVLDAEALALNTRRVLDLAVSLGKAFDVPLRVVDFGGGLGVPYLDGEKDLDLKRLSKGLAAIVAAAAKEPLLSEPRLVFEPGRFLVAEAGEYVVRVIGSKTSRGSLYLLVDGGVHHLARPALIGTPHRVRAVSPRSGRSRSCVVAGPLCTSLDILHPAAKLALPERGDLLSVENAGAYGFTESMPLFLSHEWPAEVGVRKGRIALLRKAPTVRDLLRRQLQPF